jgi:hypothetical protein
MKQFMLTNKKLYRRNALDALPCDNGGFRLKLLAAEEAAFILHRGRTDSTIHPAIREAFNTVTNTWLSLSPARFTLTRVYSSLATTYIFR